jgi:hypothetical protein
VKGTALSAVLKALLNETRESLPYLGKAPAGDALDSVVPVVHVSARWALPRLGWLHVRVALARGGRWVIGV